MAESDEHRFLTDTTLDVLQTMARTHLYGYREADRRTFDFACDLVRDWRRCLAGQTLWKHPEGVDKDIRTMLSDHQAEVCLYVAQDTTRARNIFHEAIADYRRSLAEARPWRLRVVWIPSDFRADVDEARESVASLLAEEITRDLLLNVVLGNLSPENIGLFIGSGGAVGLDLATLSRIAFSGFINVASLARSLGVSKGRLPERLVRLLGCGFLSQPEPTASFYHVTLRGRVFLELCREIRTADGHPGPELLRIMQILGLKPRLPSGHRLTSGDRYNSLVARIDASVCDFGVDLERRDYFLYWEDDLWIRLFGKSNRPWPE